jgi:hypothetical protein
LKAIFKQGDAPRKEDYKIERPVGAEAGALKLQMAIPGKGHKHIGDHQ